MHIQTINEDREISSFAIEKIREVIEKYTPHPIGVRIRFDQCRHIQTVTATVSAGPVFSAVATDSSENIFEAIDGVATKIEKQMRRKKKKILKKTRRVTKLRSDDLASNNQEPRDQDESNDFWGEPKWAHNS